MRLEQLRYLVEISHTRSITIAADNLFMSQPSLSIAMSSLEKELGVKLFIRSKTGVTPTAVGAEILELSQDALMKIEKIYVVASKEQKTEQLNIRALPAINCGIMPKALSKFQNSHPSIRTYVREDKTQTILSTLFQQGKDKTRNFGIVSISDAVNALFEDRFAESGVAKEYLCSDEQVCFVGAAHPLAEKKQITQSEIHKLPKIRYQYYENEPNDYYASLIRSTNDKSFQSMYTTEPVLTVGTVDSLKKLVAENLGVAIMPSILAYGDNYFQSGQLKILKFSDITIPMHYYIVYKAKYPLNPIEKAFIHYVKEVFQEFNDMRAQFEI
ncbi:transcriptional regulator, LysR family [Desulfitobacterium hafniense DCB-2]|uniref:Transcriptional regulator, LysR family n=1 Tax=Desulfitobacterium hafniense (strain DSM 10664 / DCB-2) TaxID=272564 RepID=B8FQH9_DESHD|nr:LysR family transcriptional regulator [Desulfitobacterium hafniense]ACL19869.1 transcriptional regulator, LysR family [Desulfitobacterium hafniense DCB-2]